MKFPATEIFERGGVSKSQPLFCRVVFFDSGVIMSIQGRIGPLPGVFSGAGAQLQSDDAEIPDAPTKLSAKERKVWKHVTDALFQQGLIHKTDGLLITVIVRTFVEWLDATEELELVKLGNGNSYIRESANGHRAPDPLYYVARDKKAELLKWLPEAALTIPSFQKTKAVAADTSPNQGQLFSDPVEDFKGRKPPMLTMVK